MLCDSAYFASWQDICRIFFIGEWERDNRIVQLAYLFISKGHCGTYCYVLRSPNFVNLQYSHTVRFYVHPNFADLQYSVCVFMTGCGAVRRLEPVSLAKNSWYYTVLLTDEEHFLHAFMFACVFVCIAVSWFLTSLVSLSLTLGAHVQ